MGLFDQSHMPHFVIEVTVEVFEFNFVDALDKASALATVQIDHENAERFGIVYTDDDGKLLRNIKLRTGSGHLW